MCGRSQRSIWKVKCVATTERDEYIPAVPPLQLSREAREFLDTELRRLADYINEKRVVIDPKAAEPARPCDGMIEYADGTNWNPGSGAGFYGYESGAWVKL